MYKKVNNNYLSLWCIKCHVNGPYIHRGDSRYFILRMSEIIIRESLRCIKSLYKPVNIKFNLFFDNIFDKHSFSVYIQHSRERYIMTRSIFVFQTLIFDRLQQVIDRVTETFFDNYKV